MSDSKAFLTGVGFGALFASILLGFWPLAVAGCVVLLLIHTSRKENHR